MPHLGDTFKNTVIEEVSLHKGNINDHDVFILDAGLNIYQINGENCDTSEKVMIKKFGLLDSYILLVQFKAMQFVVKIRDERNGKAKSSVIDGEIPDDVFSVRKRITSYVRVIHLVIYEFNSSKRDLISYGTYELFSDFGGGRS